MDWTGLATLVVGIGRGCSFCCFLLLAGRREDRRWKREVLEETMVSLFDASFGYVDRAALNAAKVGKSSASTKSALRTHMVRRYGFPPGCAFSPNRKLGLAPEFSTWHSSCATSKTSSIALSSRSRLSQSNGQSLRLNGKA